MRLGKLVVFVALIFVVVGCGKAVNENAIKSLALKGKVKSFTEHKFAPADTTVVNSKDSTISKNFMTFSRAGKVKSKVEKKERQTITYNHNFKYDGNQMVEQSSFFPDGNPSRRWVNEYDQKGNHLTKREYDTIDQVIQRWASEYDENSNETKRTHFASDNGIIQYSTYERDENNRLIKQKVFNINHQMVWYFDYVYDEAGLLTEMTILASSGSMMQKYQYKYNDKGQNVETTFTDLTSAYLVNDKITTTYDEKGNWIEKTFYDNFQLKYKYIIKRDIDYFWM